jgi:class 3 adenylate cyclase/tetratricopeptide (TPR) repeat protein
LTVLFSDLINSTNLASRLDSEEWWGLLSGYQRLAADAVRRYGGYVANFLGDGVVVYFGYPEAHENDAERAIHAGLAIIEAMAGLNTTSRENGLPEIAVRVGVHTGYVVVSGDGGIFGDAPNIAARIQTAAKPDTVLVSDATHHLVSGLFVMEASGPYSLKGIDEPIELFRAIRSSGIRGRLAIARRRGLSPFVGRHEELSLLTDLWARAANGEGQVVLINGEPGVGKSRLLLRFQEEIQVTPHIWLQGAADQFLQNTPFHAVTDTWRQSIRGRDNDSIARAKASLTSAGLDPYEALPLIAPILGLSLGDDYPQPPAPSQQRRSRLMEVLVKWMIGLARTRPIVIATEDLQWIDPSSLELNQLLVERIKSAPVLLLYTARPEFVAPWPSAPHYSRVDLKPLGTEETREVLNGIALPGVMSANFREILVERSGGVPLFLEALVQSTFERGNVMATREIPATLHDSLMERLDRLGSARPIAQIAAAIGQEFSYKLLSSVTRLADGDLRAMINQLTSAEMVLPSSSSDESYIFKHALIRDTAYEALLRSRRRELHQDIAAALVREFPKIAEGQPEVLARHWSAAGDTNQAFAAWRRAGDSASARYAFHEANLSYQNALSSIRDSSASTERDMAELEVMNALVSALQVTHGYAASETVQANIRARDLAEKTGNLQQLFLRTTATWAAVINQGAYASATPLVNQLIELAGRDRNPLSHGLAEMAHVTTTYFRGDLAGTEAAFQSGLESFGTADFQLVPGSVATAFGYAAWTAWVTGRPRLAHERIARAMAFADSTKSGYDLAYSYFMAASLELFMRNFDRACELASRALELSEQNRLVLFAAVARTVIGSAQAHTGRPREGAELIAQGITELESIDTHISATRYLTEHALALNFCGDLDGAFGEIERALSINPAELIYKAESLRVRAILLEKKGQHDAAAADFYQAIELAHNLGAIAWELRTALDFVRHLVTQGDSVRAAALLAPLKNSLSNDSSTVDYHAALALIDEIRK